MREIVLSVLIFGEILQVSLELIHPGKITANKEVVQEGETVTLKCLLAADHRRQREQYRVYLLQNGRRVQQDMGSSHLGGANFKIEQVTLEKAGRYECVYSQESMELLQGAAGSNSVNLEVKELHSFLTLQEEKHKTPQGLDAVFKCIIPHEKREIILTKPNVGYFELYQDKVLLSRQKMQSIPAVNFYFKNITQSFVGSYECVYRTDSNFTRRSRPIFFSYAEAEKVTESSTSRETSADAQNLLNIHFHKLTSVYGTDLAITCVNSHNQSGVVPHLPSSTFELYRNGELVSSQATGNSSTGTFYLKNINQSHSGNYQCAYRETPGLSQWSPSIYFEITESYFLGNIIRLIFTGLALILMLCFVVEAFINGLK